MQKYFDKEKFNKLDDELTYKKLKDIENIDNKINSFIHRNKNKKLLPKHFRKSVYFDS